ncbi:transketolase [Balneolaceae bacterium ANBcel3]|nr:transketolase [Balneolaceae bacterium ANBcel3]
MNEISIKASDNIRIFSASMVQQANSGHPGGAMGGADFMHILFSEFLVYDPNDPFWAYRDRFFLDPGHMSAMLYGTLALTGDYTMDDLRSFRQWGSVTPGHPETDVMRRVENTSGPLGQGHTFAVGAAIAERFLAQRFGEWLSHKTYAFISDGGIQEEISQGAGRLAGFLGLSNLIMFFDSNEIQLSTTTKEVTTEDTAKKYEAWGWKTITIDGHDHDQIRAALKQANAETECPTLIIGKTIMGKGCLDDAGNSFEGKCETHGQPLSGAGASFEKTIENLGGDPENPFQIFPEVEAYYKEVNQKKAEVVKERDEARKQWEQKNPELAQKLTRFLSNEVPDIDFNSLEIKEGIATRAASGNVLGFMADHIENMIVASADLSNSDKTDGFLKKTTSFQKGDFSGAFLQAGVSELTMAAVANGMALHGGVIPVCGTFFAFSDYMKPAVRLAALMELPVIYVWTHDSFRVGEDGPTHQPVEHEAQIRLMEHLKNHSGKNSVLVLRPADSEETKVAWQMALENRDTPTALILSRQNIPAVWTDGKDRASSSADARKGAYVVNDQADNPDIVLVANGSEVSTVAAVAERLKEEGVTARVVSAISEGLLSNQPDSYKKELIPSDKPVFALTAGLPVTMQGLIPPHGICSGLNHFGYSAPAGVLDEKFGFTPDTVIPKVKEYLKSFDK